MCRHEPSVSLATAVGQQRQPESVAEGPPMQRVLVPTAPDDVLGEEVPAEHIELPGQQAAQKLSPTLFSDVVLEPDQQAVHVCLAPEGMCACARARDAQEPQAPSSDQCWQVRMPAWTFSSLLFANSHTAQSIWQQQQQQQHGAAASQQELRRVSSGCCGGGFGCTAAAGRRCRTPSPERVHAVLRGGDPQARILTPPMAMVAVGPVAAPASATRHQEELRRVNSGSCCGSCGCTAAAGQRCRTPSLERAHMALRGRDPQARILTPPMAMVAVGPVAAPAVAAVTRHQEEPHRVSSSCCGGCGGAVSSTRPTAGCCGAALASGITTQALASVQDGQAHWPLVVDGISHVGDVGAAGAAAGTVKEAKRRPGRRGGRCVHVLQVATQLKKLDHVDARCVVSVRKINRLGFAARDLLRDHFSRYGGIEEILLSGAEEKVAAPGGPRVRIRPSGFGFVVFDSAEAAAAVIRDGQTQVIKDNEILINSFTRRGDTDDSRASSGSRGSSDVEDLAGSA